MSMIERLADDLTNTHLTGPPEESEHLLFKPQIGSGFSQKALDEIPRYLFRVVSPHSVGETNEMWVHSESASLNRRSSTEDIFFELNSEKGTTVARTLNLHLRWWPKDGIDDNFVSWTSSLLFAIQYIYYKHLSSKDGSGLSEIKLYAIDTKGFPEGTFLCDLDLINTFSEFDDHPPGKDLQNLRNLRNETEYYFGEYLSQGSLRIEGKCEVISAQCLFENNRLRRLQPHFREFQHLPINNGRPEWPREVNRLRDAIWRPTNLWVPSLAEVADRLGAVREIVQNLKPRWRLPLAIYFASLIGPVSFIGEIGVEPQDIFFKNLHSTLPDGMSDRSYDLVQRDYITFQILNMSSRTTSVASLQP